ALALDEQADRAAAWAADQVDRLSQVEAFEVPPVDLDDEVARPQARLLAGRAVERRDHPQAVIHKVHLHADALEAAAQLGVGQLAMLRVEEDSVRVADRFEHALDGALGELARVQRRAVVVLAVDQRPGLPEDLELLL